MWCFPPARHALYWLVSARFKWTTVTILRLIQCISSSSYWALGYCGKWVCSITNQIHPMRPRATSLHPTRPRTPNPEQGMAWPEPDTGKYWGNIREEITIIVICDYKATDRIIAEPATWSQRLRCIQEDVPLYYKSKQLRTGKLHHVTNRDPDDSDTRLNRDICSFENWTKTPTIRTSLIFSTRTVWKGIFCYWYTCNWVRHLNERGQDVASDTHAWIDSPICFIQFY